MDVAYWVLVGLILVVALFVKVVRGVFGIFKDAAAVGDHARERSRAWVEARCAHYLMLFPQANDAQIAVLVRDELVNARLNDVNAYAWATEYTAGRIRRNMLLQSRGLRA